jgi:hypothetical protein
VVALRYDLQVLFEGTTCGVMSIIRSKYELGVEGIGHYVALGQCMKCRSQEPQSHDWRIVRKDVVVTCVVGKETAIDEHIDD